MKDYDRNKESSYLQRGNVNNLDTCGMSQKLYSFKWIECTSQFNEDFIKTIMKKMMKGIFLKLILNILKNHMNFIMVYHFYLKK